tara:strand:+ start:188 stop:907 length:720 start_codon:yes stop_codon:yes gene_type:complete
VAVTKDTSGPYAPTSVIVDLITRNRSRGLPFPLTTESLGRIGVSDSLISRTLQTLVVLDLIDDKGSATAIFEKIRLAPEAEYKQRMQEWLNAAYADVIAIVDPAQDDETKIRDAFRFYNPVGQQSRMVTLFLGLYSAAGVISEKTAQPRSPRASSPKPRSVPPAGKAKVLKGRSNVAQADTTGIPAPILGMLARLPVEGESWTSQKRKSFLDAFGPVLDFCFPIDDTPDEKAASQGDGS